MNWFSSFKKDFISSRLKAIDGQLTQINREVKKLDRFVSHPRLEKKADPLVITRRLGGAVLPESEKRFVSYLSAGSFQTISLRRHEQRAAKIKTVIATAAVILIVFLLVYFFAKTMFS